MTSIHTRVPSWVTLDPEDASTLTPTVVSLHFSTARPLEVRIRVPMQAIVGYGDSPGRRQWAAWSADRAMLKASACVVGGKFGIGDVRLGIGTRSWLAELRRNNLRVVVGSQPFWIRTFMARVDRLSPPGEPVDVDPWIAQLLGASS